MILDSKSCYQVCHIRVIRKVLENIKNIVELAVKVEKSNCNRFQSRYKLIEIKGAATDMRYLQGASSLGVKFTRNILA